MSFKELQFHKEKQCWIQAMEEEMNSLKKNDIYDLVEIPKGRKILRNKWVFKLKKDDNQIINIRLEWW